MKKTILIVLLMSAFNAYSDECNVGEVLVASCVLPGKTQRVAVFCANKKNNTVYYFFRKGAVKNLTVNFNVSSKLKRWLDQGTYTTYFGFKRGGYSYVLGVPEESPGALAFLDVKKDGVTITSKECNENSFGEKDIKSNAIEDVPDSSVRDNGFKFP